MIDDDGADLLVGVKWGDEKPQQGDLCPVCALPLRWRQHPVEQLRGWRCWGEVSAARHGHIERMRRAAAACEAADYPAFAAVIVADLDRLRSVRQAAA